MMYNVPHPWTMFCGIFVRDKLSNFGSFIHKKLDSSSLLFNFSFEWGLLYNSKIFQRMYFVLAVNKMRNFLYQKPDHGEKKTRKNMKILKVVWRRYELLRFFGNYRNHENQKKKMRFFCFQICNNRTVERSIEKTFLYEKTEKNMPLK